MDSLKTRYQSLNQLFFCEDYLVDGILTDFAAFCKQQEIEADILFQNYHRGNIQIEDIVDILLKFIKYAKIAGKVQLHVAAVKNQLIFSMKLTEKNMGKTAIYISKRLFRVNMIRILEIMEKILSMKPCVMLRLWIQA